MTNLMDKDDALATQKALEAYVGYFQEKHGEKCKLRPNNLFTVQFLIGNLIEMLILGNDDLDKALAQVNTAIASAQVKLFDEVK